MNWVMGNDTLSSLLTHRATVTPERHFVTFDDLDGHTTHWSWAAFDCQVNRAAHVLLDHGIEQGDTLHLHLPNSMEFLWLWFAAARIGAAIMPTNTASPAAELDYLVQHSRSRLCITTDALASTLGDVAARAPEVSTMLISDGAGDAPDSLHAAMARASDSPPDAPLPSPEDLAAILYTSGTTARPKGVMVTHANYLYAGHTVAKAIRLTPDDLHLTTLPLFHGNAQYYSTMSALVTGASMVLLGRFSASRFFDKAIEFGCTVTSLFAAPMRMLLAQPERPELRNNGLRLCLFAQNLTPDQHTHWQRRFGAPPLQLWGMTETMGPPLMNPIDGERRNQSIGRAVMGYRVALVDERMRAVAPGDIGEIVVQGEPGWTLMKGYFRNEEATTATLRDGWLHSGDNARQDADGYFHFVDRRKDMIKRSGENVAATEVESVVLEHPAVFDCAVIGVPDAIRDERIVACVVLHEGHRAEAEDIIAWCRERLASFRVPEIVEFHPNLPRTSVGKIQKHLLRDAAARLHTTTDG